MQTSGGGEAAAGDSPTSGPEGPPNPRRWLILGVVGLGNVMSALDTFIVNVAIPSIRHGLHATSGDAELVVTVYALVYASLLITGGRLGDLFGRTRVYLWGMALFTLASALSGMAPTAGVLVGARALQACGAALMVPQAYSVVQRVFGQSERVRAISVLTMGGSIAVVFAQVVGGSLIQLNIFGLGWRVVFLVNLPIGVAGIVAGMVLLPRTRPERTSALDLPGVAMVTTALLLLVVPLSEGSDLGWPPWLLATMACSPVMAAYAMRYERRRLAGGRVPLLDLTLFKERTYSVGVSLASLNQITNAGLFFVIALYLQIGRGLSPGLAGVVFAPLGLGYLAIAPWSPRLLGLLGRNCIALGYLLVAAAVGSFIVVLVVAGPDVSPFALVPSIFMVGAGQGFVNSPLYATALSRVRRGQEGSASGMITTLQQTGGSIGVAVEGLVFFSALGLSGAATRVSSALGSVAIQRAMWVNVGFDVLGVVVVLLFLPVWQPPPKFVTAVPDAESLLGTEAVGAPALEPAPTAATGER